MFCSIFVHMADWAPDVRLDGKHEIFLMLATVAECPFLLGMYQCAIILPALKNRPSIQAIISCARQTVRFPL